jgi:ABC-type multidrug transport system fused ATPase/permease subunit
MKNCWKMFIISGIFKLFGDLCGLVGPLSISHIVEFISLQLLNANASHAVLSLSDASSVAPHKYSSNGATMHLHNETTTTITTSPVASATIITRNYTVAIINNHQYSLTWSEFLSNGWIVSVIVLISFLLQGTFSQASTNFINMEGIKIKNALQGLIYRKTLCLSTSCYQQREAVKVNNNNDGSDNSSLHNENEDRDSSDASKENNPGTITNLMSEDSLNVMSFFWICHYVWSIPLKVDLNL